MTRIDPARLVRIDVTAADIFDGRIRSCSKCPVALALTRALGETTLVGRHSFSIGDFYSLKLPKSAEEFIDKYDDFGYGEPFSFNVEIPAAGGG